MTDIKITLSDRDILALCQQYGYTDGDQVDFAVKQIIKFIVSNSNDIEIRNSVDVVTKQVKEDNLKQPEPVATVITVK